uniref:Serpin domain-containing protein n=1 Tax=Anopheles christyi TaxID=43041 RepID=A0A182JX17_9DIPT
MKLAAGFTAVWLLLLCIAAEGASTGPDLSFGDADFSVQYFKHSFNASANSVVSPVAVRLVFSALYQVTDSGTREAVQRAFYLPSDVSNARTNAEQLVNDLEQSRFLNVSFTLLQSEGQLSQELEDAARTIFHVKPRIVVFANRRRVVEEVNDWAVQVTEGRIRHYLAESDVEVNAELMLLNALHLRADWAQKFAIDQTVNDKFQFRNGPALVEMMSVSLEVLYYAQPKWHTIQLPYSEESDLTMWILLPHRDGTFEELFELLSAELLDELETSVTPKMVDLWLPKFTIDDGHDARDVLKLMGHEMLFDREGFSVFRNHKSMLGALKQRTFIQVNENGTEAAAVTSVGTKFRVRNTQFRADRPFIFIIKKLSIDTILFVGHYSNHN